MNPRPDDIAAEALAFGRMEQMPIGSFLGRGHPVHVQMYGSSEGIPGDPRALWHNRILPHLSGRCGHGPNPMGGS